MNLKQNLVTILTITLILALGVGGYFLVVNYTQKRLGQLEQEALTDQDSEATTSQTREITLPEQPQAKQNSSIYLQAEKENYVLGETFNLLVMVKSEGEVIDGVEFILEYDPQTISIGEPELGTFFSLYPQKEVDQEKGTIRLAAIQSPDEHKELNEEIIVSLPITTLKSGTTILTFIKDKTHIAAYGGQDLLGKEENLTLKVE